jgi:hypothetical protein
MLDWIKNIFKSDSEVSSMRVMSMISLLTGCYIGISGLYQGKNLSELAILCGTFLGAAMGGKVLQKQTELKGDKA